MAGTRGWTRCVKQEGPEGQECPFLNETFGLRSLCPELVDRLRGKAAEAMRPIDDAHRSILCATRIEMNADRQHLLENLDRWLHVWHAGLVCPSAIARDIDAVLRGHGQVLMPDDFPVRVGRFIEEEGANGEARLAEDRTSESPQRRRRSKYGDVGVVEEVTCTATPGVREGDYAGTQLGDGIGVNHGLSDCPSGRGD